jgi:hypothetical protein
MLVVVVCDYHTKKKKIINQKRVINLHFYTTSYDSITKQNDISHDRYRDDDDLFLLLPETYCFCCCRMNPWMKSPVPTCTTRPSSAQ